MKRGSVSQRHRADCPRGGDGALLPHRCRHSWQFTVDVRRGADEGRRQITKAGFPTKREAQLALQRYLEEDRAGVDVATRLTLGDYLDHWLEGKRALRPSTLRSYREHIQLYLRPRLGSLRLREVRPDDVDRLLADLSTGQRRRSLSAATQRRIYATLRAALNDAVARRLLAYNPVLHVELPREERAATIVWTPAQVATFLDHVAQDRLYGLYHLVIVTGLRRGEVTGLRWKDLDLDLGHLRVTQQIVQLGGTLHVGPPKTRRGRRTVPLDPITVAVLRDHAGRQRAERRAWGAAWMDSGLVFTREDGRPLSPEVISRRFKAAAAGAGLPTIRFHDLRHTSASLALAAGVAMKVVSDRLGHSTSGITADLYTHVSPAVGRRAAAAIAATFTDLRRRDVDQLLTRDRGDDTPDPSATKEE
jgi:integrase